MANMTSGGSKDSVTNDDAVSPTILSVILSYAATTETAPAAERPIDLYTSPDIGIRWLVYDLIRRFFAQSCGRRSINKFFGSRRLRASPQGYSPWTSLVGAC